METQIELMELACTIGNQFEFDNVDMIELSKIMGIEHFGIESIVSPDGEFVLTYLNSGFTYISVICKENSYGSSWEINDCGSWLEEKEREFEKENEVWRCGYCGEFTPQIGNWNTCICQSCKRNITTGEFSE